MNKLKVKETFSFPSGVTFQKDEEYWGYTSYYSNLEKRTLDEISIIFKEGFPNGLMVYSENFICLE